MPEVTTQSFDLDAYDASLVQEVVDIDTDVNPLAVPPPVDDGIHRFKWTIKEGSIEHAETKVNPKTGESRAYVKLQVTGHCIEEGTSNNNKLVFVRLNTLVFDGKSEMGYFLLKALGDTSEAKTYVASLNNYLKLAQAFKKHFAGEPIVKARTQWQANYNAGTKDAPQYKVAKSGQKNFPPNGRGGYNHIINVDGVGEVAAQAVVKDYLVD